MFKLDMGGVVLEELTGLKRVEYPPHKMEIFLVFEGKNGNEVFINASAMHVGDVWNVKEYANV